MKLTNTNALIIAVTEHGWKEVESGTSKARTFLKDSTNTKVFIGRAGSCRVGVCYSKSHPISERIKNLMLLEGFQKIKARS